MNRKPLAELIPVLAKAIGPTTAVATGLLAPAAFGASGDLDPDFADHGRLGPIAELKGPAWSLEALDDEGMLLAGGYLEAPCRSYYCWYDSEFEASNFVDALTEDGGIDASYHATVISDVEVFDIARQADGKVVAAGRRVGSQPTFVQQARRIPPRGRGSARHGLRKQRDLRAGLRALRIPQPGELGARGSGRAHRHRGRQGRISHRVAPGCSRSARRVVRFRWHSHRARARLLGREPNRAYRFGRLPRHDG